MLKSPKKKINKYIQCPTITNTESEIVIQANFIKGNEKSQANQKTTAASKIVLRHISRNGTN